MRVPKDTPFRHLVSLVACPALLCAAPSGLALTLDAAKARVQTVEFVSPAGSAAPVLATLQQVAAESRAREDRILAQSDADIERHRKGDAVIRVVDGQGRAVSAAKVMIEQVQHDFLFGCNIYAFDRFKTEAQNSIWPRTPRRKSSFACRRRTTFPLFMDFGRVPALLRSTRSLVHARND